MSLSIWVDADAIPNLIKDVIIRAAVRLNIKTVFVANKWTRLPAETCLSFVQVSHGDDVADAYIVTNSAEGDIAISADIPLASLLVKKGVTVIDPRGDLITESNAGERLSVRDFMSNMRGAGLTQGGPPALNNRDVQKFSNAFDALVTKKRKAI